MSQLLYQQTPLPERSIRLLTVFPSLSPTSPIICGVSVVPLPDDSSESWPEYRALSYAWRETVPEAKYPSTVICCNGLEIETSPNLYAALVSLRQKYSEPLTLWVDYLCINQLDIDERSSQVRLMGEIFRHSSEVLIWLGEPSVPHLETDNQQHHYRWGGVQDDEPLVQYYQTLFDASVQSGNLRKSQRAIDAALAECGGHAFGVFCVLSSLSQNIPATHLRFYWSPVETLEYQMWASSLRQSIQNIVNKAWWQRTWVVQECVLAKILTVHYGHLSCPWSVFERGASFYRSNCASHDPILDTNASDPLASPAFLVAQIQGPRQTINQGQLLSSLDALRHFHGREATDARDKVFGLLELLDQPPLVPDYSMSKPEVYLAAAMHIISSSGNLDLLAGQNRHNQIGIPSWSPDWSIPAKECERLRIQNLNQYDASKSIPAATAMVHMLQRQAILEVSGVYIDKVRHVSPDLGPEDGFYRWRRLEFLWQDFARRSLGYPAIMWHPEVRATSRFLSKDPLVELDEPWINDGYAHVFWRALCGDMTYVGGDQTQKESYRRVVPTDFASYASFLDGNAAGSRRSVTVKGRRTFRPVRSDGVNRQRNEFLYAINAMSGDRHIFVTEGGRIGVGPRGTTEGDQVTVLAGSKVPLLLRQCGNVSCGASKVEQLLPSLGEKTTSEMVCDATHEAYMVVGDAYVYGVMDGEVEMQEDGQLQSIFLL
ncbi:hypothetical protein FDECE_16885 [Fusarium decemcellulare]|nr:hypothetical protein FDECE_16885 [Fusarium decemcellulare]